MKQLPIEITNEQVCQELDMWFNNEECGLCSDNLFPRGLNYRCQFRVTIAFFLLTRGIFGRFVIASCCVFIGIGLRFLALGLRRYIAVFLFIYFNVSRAYALTEAI